MGGLFFQFVLDYWYAVLFLIALIWIMAKVFSLIKVEGPQLKSRTVSYAAGVIAMLLITGLVIAA